MNKYEEGYYKFIEDLKYIDELINSLTIEQRKSLGATTWSIQGVLGRYINEEKDFIKELVDKETPVKPVKKQYKYSHHLHCGKCDERFCVVRYDDIKNDIVYKHKLSYKKCPECFQKVDWSD